MDGKQVIKILKQQGWQEARIRGSHHVMKKSGYLPIVVPVHGKKDLKPGTLKSIEKATGIKMRRL